MLVEAVAVRPFVRRGSSAWLMATGGARHRGRQHCALHFRQGTARLPDVAGFGARSPGSTCRGLQIAIPVVGLALAAGLHFFSRKTSLGKAMLAVVQNPTPRA
jgi:branched-chain amino acid transport system permease protein